MKFKFKYWHFVTLYFMLVLIIEWVQAYATKTFSSDSFQRDSLIIIGYCGLIDYMDDRMGV